MDNPLRNAPHKTLGHARPRHGSRSLRRLLERLSQIAPYPSPYKLPGDSTTSRFSPKIHHALLIIGGFGAELFTRLATLLFGKQAASDYSFLRPCDLFGPRCDTTATVPCWVAPLRSPGEGPVARRCAAGCRPRLQKAV